MRVRVQHGQAEEDQAARRLVAKSRVHIAKAAAGEFGAKKFIKP